MRRIYLVPAFVTAVGLMAVGATLPRAVENKMIAQTRESLTEEFHKTYPIAPNGRVSLRNINGDVVITAWERDEIQIDAVKRAPTQEMLNEAQIRVESTPAAVNIMTKYPEETKLPPAKVAYKIFVPRQVQLENIEIITGELSIENVTGEINASTVNGRITARALSAGAKLSTFNGRLEAVFNKLDDVKSVSLKTVNGPVVLRIPANAGAEFVANSMHGRIRNDFGLTTQRGDLLGGNLSGVIGNGGTRITLNNVNGGIAILRWPDNGSN